MNGGSFRSEGGPPSELGRQVAIRGHTIKRRVFPPLHRSAWESRRSINADGGCRMLFAQDHAQEAIVNRQRAIAFVIDKAQRPELVHEMTDS